MMTASIFVALLTGIQYGCYILVILACIKYLRKK